MKKNFKSFFKKIGVVVMTLAMLITMIPATEYSADMDVNAPMIESTSLDQNGKTDLTFGDKITFTFTGYDQDSEITWVYLLGSGMPYEFKGQPVETAENTYVLQETIDENWVGDWSISTAEFVDSNGNTTKVKVDYSFSVVATYDESTVVELTTNKQAIVFDEEHLTGDIEYYATISGNKKEIEWLRVTYDVVGENGYNYQDKLSLSPNVDGGYRGGLSFESPTNSRTYYAKEIFVRYKDGTSAFLKNVPTFSFSIKNTISDNESPMITSMSLDKQGEYLESGSVTFTVTAEDEHKLNTSGTLILASPVNANRYGLELKQTEVSEDGKKATYTATTTFNDYFPSEWYVADVLLSDVVGNGGNSSGLSSVEFSDYYFFVNKEGFVEKTYNNVTIRMVDNENSNLAYVSDTMPRRVKLADVFGDKWVETLPDDEVLGKFVGWDYNGTLVTKDTIMLVQGDNSYITIKPRYEKQKINVSYTYLNGAYNGWGYEQIITDKKLTYGDLMEKIKCPENAQYTFTAWSTDYINKDAYVTDSYVTLYAEYDKYPVNIRIAYLDETGNLKIINEQKDFVAGTSYQDIIDSYNTNVSNWLYSGMNYQSLKGIIVSVQDMFIEANGAYEDKQIVQYDYSWITDSNESKEYGEYASELGYIVVDKADALSKDTLAEKVIANTKADYFDAITSHRITSNVSDYNNDKYADEVYLYSDYDEDIIVNIFGYDENTDEEIFDRYYVVKPGQTFYLPTEYNGEKIYWLNEENYEYYTGSFTIPEDVDGGWMYWFYMSDELPEDAKLHENEVLPTQPSTPVVPSVPEEKPVVKLEEEKITETTNKIEEAIKEAEKNDATTETTKPVQVVVDMKKEDGTVATEVPKEILEAAKGQNVEVVLDMGDYSWTINGSDIKATNLKDINLEVELGTKNIPSATVEKIANGQETHQLSLTHNGDFGFKANLTINLGKEKEGKYGNLYYYDSDGKLVFMNAGKIDADGNVSLAFSHASEYVVVISDKAVEAPKTGDNTNVAMYLAILFAGAALTVVAMKKKENSNF